MTVAVPLPVVESLSLTGLSADLFRAQHQVIPSGRAYGGEVVAQAVAAAMRTNGPDRAIHSFHGYFLRPGDVNRPTDYAVERVRDGRGFSQRAVTGVQDGKEIFRGLASFHVRAEGVEHADTLPAGLPDPESLPTSAEAVAGSDVRDADYWAWHRSFDMRHCSPPVYLTPAPERQTSQVVWLKAFAPMPDDPDLHRAALAYLCDYTLLETVLRGHGAAWSTPGVTTASLDHAMWWHADGRVDDWVALVQDSPCAAGGLGLTRARIFARSGTLLASVMQEGLVAGI